jgi:ParB/RepB/Spo0J family partition protein
MQIEVKKISPVDNVRLEEITDESVEGLAQSIKETGLIQPIVVAKNGKGFEIIVGHRRLKAVQLLNAMTIEAHVVDKPEDITTIQMVENIQRKDLTFKEEVIAVVTYFKAGITVETLANMFGRSEKWVRYRMRFARLIPVLFKMIDDSESVLDHLINITEYAEKHQRKAVKYVKDEFGQLDLWQVEMFLRELTSDKISEMPWTEIDDRFVKPCATCKDRAGAQLGVFEDVLKGMDDRCLNNDCYLKKKIAAIEWIHGILEDESIANVKGDFYFKPNEVRGLPVKKFKQIEPHDLFRMKEETLRETLQEFSHFNYIAVGDNRNVSVAKLHLLKLGQKKVKKVKKDGKEITVLNEITSATGNKLRKALFIPIADALWNHIITTEPKLNGPGSAYLINQLFSFTSVIKKIQDGTRFGELNRTTLIVGDEKKIHDRNTVFSLSNAMIKAYLLFYDLDALIGNGKRGSRFSDKSYHIKNVAKAYKFNFKKWLKEYYASNRTELLTCFTKKELLAAADDVQEYAGKPKATVVSLIANRAKTIPHLDLMMKKWHFVTQGYKIEEDEVINFIK